MPELLDRLDRIPQVSSRWFGEQIDDVLFRPSWDCQGAKRAIRIPLFAKNSVIAGDQLFVAAAKWRAER